MDIVFLNKNRPLMELDIDIQTSYVKEILHVYNVRWNADCLSRIFP